MFNLSFLLRQHTPLLHFQYDQTGATLRATELKSKLDRFVIAQETKCYSNEAEVRLNAMKTKHSDWLQRKGETDKPALDYSVKVTVIQSSQRPYQTIDKFPLYFGNMGDENKKSPKHLVFNEFVGVEFFSTNHDLLKHIQDNFSTFLLQTNFGTRQSKGFGSYYLVNQPEDFAKQVENYYAFDVDVSEQNNEFYKAKRLFEVIELFYRTLRSGINQVNRDGATEFYFKSMLWSYLRSQEIQWDKKTIKQEFFKDRENREKTKHKSNQAKEEQEDLFAELNDNDYIEEEEIDEDAFPIFYEGGKKVNVKIGEKKVDFKTHQLWRDLLGLSMQQSWHYYNDEITKEHLNDNTIQNATIESGKLKWGAVKSDFSRMASPIFFKPLRISETKYSVFFGVPQHIKEAFLGKRSDVAEAKILSSWFKIHSKNKNESFAIPFPTAFDFDAFFKHAFSQDLKKHIEKKFHKSSGEKDPPTDFEILQDIYKTLEAQVKK